MFVRIVKMGFHAKEVKGFLNTFNAKKEHIRNTKGCQLLELYRDKNDPTVFFTYSYWEREIDLENYRNQPYLRVFGQKQKYDSTKNLRLGVLTKQSF